MKGKIVGGVIVLVLGGSTFAISQADVVDNFAEETGMSQTQAQQYVEDAQDDLQEFSQVGQDFIDDGTQALNAVKDIDCVNYAYEWESPTLTCDQGKSQLRTIGENEITLGNCYKALGTDLGKTATSKINECISDIDVLNANYSLPVAISLLDSATLTESTQTNLYNKSVLRAALEAK